MICTTQYLNSDLLLLKLPREFEIKLVSFQTFLKSFFFLAVNENSQRYLYACIYYMSMLVSMHSHIHTHISKNTFKYKCVCIYVYKYTMSMPHSLNFQLLKVEAMNGFYFLNHLYKAVLILLFSKYISLAFCLLTCFNKIKQFYFFIIKINNF